tara:strand:- start:1261 stop:1533 length:273 start_codon:yes stop_codon:yes gene_type:complete
VTEGNADEPEIADTSDRCCQGDHGHPPGNFKQYLVKEKVRMVLDGLRFLAPHGKKYLGDYAPPSTWVVVSQLTNPKMVIEMETIAARSDD